MIEKLKYKFLQLYKLIFLKLQYVFMLFFKNKNKELLEIISYNRKIINSYNPIFELDEFNKNNYGMSYQNFKNINKNMNDTICYSDLINFIAKKLFDKKINYLEIGSSVMKNYIQILEFTNNSYLTCFDINNIPRKFEYLFTDYDNSLYSGVFKTNKIFYYKGDVLNANDTKIFSNKIKQKFNLVFSDALHTPNAVKTEFENIISSNLSSNFLIYYEDLNFPGLENTFFDLYKRLSIGKKVCATTFYIHGWIGQNEKLHKNGIISTYNLESFFKNNEIKLPFQKFY